MKISKYLVAVATVSLLFVSCKNNEKQEEAQTVEEEVAVLEVDYDSFGEKITDENVLSRKEMSEKFQNLKPGDTVPVKFSSKVNSVCQKKGCWMRLDMGQEEAMVTFKDYGFFMPTDLAGSEVIVEGVAYVEEMDVDTQRHYAEDAGKSEDEIQAITEPKNVPAFVATGVLVPSKG